MPRFAAMRIALALLVATTGCNWVFGLDATTKTDAAPDANPIRTKLVWAVATTDGMPNGEGIDPVIEYAAIGGESSRTMTPIIQVGDTQGLEQVSYDISDGSFEIPQRLRTAPHRIVYTLPGESVTHEVQWSVAGAFLVVPRTTRLDAPAVPPGSGYTIRPAGLTGTPLQPALVTSGVLTYASSASDFELSAGTVTFRFASKAKPVAGPLGAPQAGLGDWVLVADWAARSATQASVSGWAITQVDLTSNMMTSPVTAPTWNTGPASERTLSALSCPGTQCLPLFNVSLTKMRMSNTLGGLAGSTIVERMAYGVSPSIELPGFLPGVAPDFVERPLMIPFGESASHDQAMLLSDPSVMLPLTRVMSSSLTTTRAASGVNLTSSLQAISHVFGGAFPYPAPLATNIQLGSANLSGTADDVEVPAGSSVKDLSFIPEAGFDADDYVITLYEIVSPALVPVRIFHVLAPSLAIDGTLLAVGHTYVFGITARKGMAGADRGDYRTATFPFGSSTTFSRTFVVR